MRRAASYGEWTKTGPIREVVDLPKAISFGAGERRLIDAMRLGATSTSQRNVEISKQGVRGEHDINPLDPMQTEEIHEAKSRRKRRDRPESKGMKMGNNPAQWLMAGVSPSFTHHVLMRYGPSSYSHPHILGVQSRQETNSSVTIQELPAESDTQTQGDDPSLTISQLLPQLSMRRGRRQGAAYNLGCPIGGLG